MRLFIDGDGCPVIDIALNLAQKHQIPLTIVCDEAHFFQKPYGQILQVSKGRDSVDFALVNALKKGDLVITQDYGLAAMALAKKAYVLHQDGFFYTEENIESLLMSRHMNQKILSQGGRIKGPKKRNQKQNLTFSMVLEEFLLKENQE